MTPSRSDDVWLAGFFIAAVMIAFGSLGCKGRKGHESSDLDRGRAALAAGRPADALPFLEKAVKERPGRLGPRRLLAKALVGLGKLSKARQILRRGINVSEKGDPERYPLLLDMADVLVRQGRYGEAAKVYGQAIEEKPEQVVAYWRLGELYEMNRQWRDARAAYESLLRRSPGGPVVAEIRLRMARSALKDGDFQRALRDARLGLSIQRAAPRVRADLERLAGRAAMAAKDWKGSAEHLRKALDLGLQDSGTLTLYARAIFQSEGCRGQTLIALRRAVRAGGDPWPKALACLADSGKEGDKGLALKAAQKADRRGRLDQEGKVVLARLLLGAGKPDRALDVLDAMAASKGRLGPKAGLLRAQSLAALGRHGAAFEQFSRLVAQGLQNPKVLRGQALEAVWSGRYAAGARLLKSLMRRKARDPELLTAWGVALGGLGRWAQARKTLEAAAAAARAAKDTRALERVLVYSAWLDLRTGRLNKALATSRALAGRPGPFQLHALDILAQALIRLGRKAEAARVIQKALTLRSDPAKKAYFRSLLSGLSDQLSPRRRE